MNLYLISQDINDDYDTYDSAVVAAKSPSDAKNIHPSSPVTHATDGEWMGAYANGEEYQADSTDWVPYSRIDSIDVVYLGKTRLERGVVLASFNAG